MNKVYVLIHKDDMDELDVEIFKDKEAAIAKVMETVYGEDWEAQAADEEWDLYDDIQTDLDALWYGNNEVIDDSGSWTLKEAEIQD